VPILPVLDLMQGQIVRGVAGRRHEYRPVVSTLTPSAAPLDIALAFRRHFGFDALYLADLDAIAGAAPAGATYAQLRDHGFRLWIDAGLRGPADDRLAMLEATADTVIVGLETLDGPGALSAVFERLGDRLVFSLDLKGGRPLGRADRWPDDAWAIAQTALALGVRRILVLDLARVGVGEGTGTETLCTRLRAHDSGLEITAGGGVRGPDDVRRLVAAGVNHVLVASALHDGRLTRADLA
jgi:phosphoribosylformimino-5-aminoimidazole carboxamide ribotide isomerase